MVLLDGALGERRGPTALHLADRLDRRLAGTVFAPIKGIASASQDGRSSIMAAAKSIRASPPVHVPHFERRAGRSPGCLATRELGRSLSWHIGPRLVGRSSTAGGSDVRSSTRWAGCALGSVGRRDPTPECLSRSGCWTVASDVRCVTRVGGPRRARPRDLVDVHRPVAGRLPQRGKKTGESNQTVSIRRAHRICRRRFTHTTTPSTGSPSPGLTARTSGDISRAGQWSTHDDRSDAAAEDRPHRCDAGLQYKPTFSITKDGHPSARSRSKPESFCAAASVFVQRGLVVQSCRRRASPG